MFLSSHYCDCHGISARSIFTHWAWDMWQWSQTYTFQTNCTELYLGASLQNCSQVRMPQILGDGKLTLFQVMAWCRQASSQSLIQCWPISMSPYGVAMSQCANSEFATWWRVVDLSISHYVYQWPHNHLQWAYFLTNYEVKCQQGTFINDIIDFSGCSCLGIYIVAEESGTKAVEHIWWP